MASFYIFAPKIFLAPSLPPKYFDAGATKVPPTFPPQKKFYLPFTLLP